MNNKSKYTFLTYLFLILTIFLLFLFTKDFYYNIKQNSSQIKEIKQQIVDKESEYANIAKIKSEIKDFDIIINTTSVGMKPLENETPISTKFIVNK